MKLFDRFNQEICPGKFVTYATGGQNAQLRVGLVQKVYTTESWNEWDRWRVQVKCLKITETTKREWSNEEGYRTVRFSNVQLTIYRPTLTKITNVIVVPEEIFLTAAVSYKALLSLETIHDTMNVPGIYSQSELDRLLLDGTWSESE